MEYDGEEDVRDCDLAVVAPKSCTYVLLILNEGDEDIDVTVDATVWDAADED